MPYIVVTAVNTSTGVVESNDVMSVANPAHAFEVLARYVTRTAEPQYALDVLTAWHNSGGVRAVKDNGRTWRETYLYVSGRVEEDD